MRWTWRPAGDDSGLGAVLDAGLAVVAAALTALVAWGPPGHLGTQIAGPPWLRAVLPLLIGAPLAWRRRAPLLMWTALWAAITLQAVATLKAPAGLELMFPLFVGGYSVAVHSRRRRALAALAIMIPGAVTYVLASHGIKPNLLLIPPHGALATGQSRASSLFFVGEILACWMLGVLVRARRDEAALAARGAALERQAEQAVAAERVRIARELHDIVAHHLSVVVLQASGARASGKPADGALQKIERSGREALTEMRRLLEVLREPHEESGRHPQPGVGELPALAESVRAAGLTVELVFDTDGGALPAAVDVCAYRIVQEALTNVLKHAGPAHAEVTVRCADGALTIEVTDDGVGASAAGSQPAGLRAGGQGLVGMRERAAIFGGELQAGPRPGGGFAVRARLPLGGEPPSEPLPPVPPAVPGVAPAMADVAPASADVPPAPPAPPGLAPAPADVLPAPPAPSGLAPAVPGVAPAPPAPPAAPPGVPPAVPGVAPAPADVRARASIARGSGASYPRSAP